MNTGLLYGPCTRTVHGVEWPDIIPCLIETPLNQYALLVKLKYLVFLAQIFE